MTLIKGIQTVGKNDGKGLSLEDKFGMFLKVFSGEVLTAFTRTTVTNTRHTIRSIQHGKSASFPVLGRTTARYLESGASLDEGREKIKGTEKVIVVDGLLVSDVMISDIEDAMNHFDVKSEYSKQLGEALAIAYDGAVLAEIAAGCNIATLNNENIEGLGKPVVLKVPNTQKGSYLNDPEIWGKGILKMLAQAQAKLNAQYVPQGERYFYCKPEVYAAISAALLPTGSNFAAISNPQSGTLTNIFGFEIIQVPHLTVGGVGGKHQWVSVANGAEGPQQVGKDNVIGLFHHRSAVGTVKLKDMSIERGRRIEYQSDIIVGKQSMGHGLLRPEALGALITNS